MSVTEELTKEELNCPTKSDISPSIDNNAIEPNINNNVEETKENAKRQRSFDSEEFFEFEISKKYKSFREYDEKNFDNSFANTDDLKKPLCDKQIKDKEKGKNKNKSTKRKKKTREEKQNTPCSEEKIEKTQQKKVKFKKHSSNKKKGIKTEVQVLNQNIQNIEEKIEQNQLAENNESKIGDLKNTEIEESIQNQLDIGNGSKKCDIKNTETVEIVENCENLKNQQTGPKENIMEEFNNSTKDECNEKPTSVANIPFVFVDVKDRESPPSEILNNLPTDSYRQQRTQNWVEEIAALSQKMNSTESCISIGHNNFNCNDILIPESDSDKDLMSDSE